MIWLSTGHCQNDLLKLIHYILEDLLFILHFDCNVCDEIGIIRVPSIALT